MSDITSRIFDKLDKMGDQVTGIAIDVGILKERTADIDGLLSKQSGERMLQNHVESHHRHSMIAHKGWNLDQAKIKLILAAAALLSALATGAGAGVWFSR